MEAKSQSYPTSSRAREARDLVESLQSGFREGLESLVSPEDAGFQTHRWLRDEGRHGGGSRFQALESSLFWGASINVSVVHYDDDPERRLGSATALSTIIHPRHPRCPSVHMHFSWTEMKSGDGGWRAMVDLNPSLEEEEGRARFEQVLYDVAGDLADEGFRQGDKYFYIPALERHRGVVHFYLEGYSSGSFQSDRDLVQAIAGASTEAYCQLLAERLPGLEEPTEEERKAQLHYHTVYFFQVLTLDRGTTSGLLVHDQNDVGIMASLPPRVDRELLLSWLPLMPTPQGELLQGLADALGDQGIAYVDEACRARLAGVVRDHYKAHPEALKLQAAGDRTPPTVANHGGSD